MAARKENDSTRPAGAARRRRPARPRARGYSLLEVLIAVFVLSVGLLGIAALQVFNIKINASTQAASQVVLLANDIADRMRANRLALFDIDHNYVGFYNSADTTNGVTATNNKCAETNAESAADCTVQQMAQFDLFEWNNAITTLVPGGSGVVCIDATPEDGTAADAQCDYDAADYDGATDPEPIYAIKLFWTDRVDGDAEERRFVLQFQL